MAWVVVPEPVLFTNILLCMEGRNRKQQWFTHPASVPFLPASLPASVLNLPPCQPSISELDSSLPLRESLPIFFPSYLLPFSPTAGHPHISFSSHFPPFCLIFWTPAFLLLSLLTDYHLPPVNLIVGFPPLFPPFCLRFSLIAGLPPCLSSVS